MQDYIVAEGRLLQHDGKDYAEGKAIKLDDDAAAPLLAAGAIQAKPAKASKKADETGE